MELRSRWRSYSRTLLLAGVLFVGAGSHAAAQKAVPAMIGKDIEHFGRDLWAIWTSPFDASAHDLLGALAVLGVGAAISPIDDDVDRWVVRNKENWLFNAVEP